MRPHHRRHVPQVSPAADEMAWIEGGSFRMGSDSHYPEERPAHRVAVAGFFIEWRR
ncbi:formylglycine-generating enzyme required for sulfatase activity [Ancylobacter sp. 3268]|nr:formylglycine-generating enzyme required for sulfatase activity [Ancylobacter sp. 3268]